MSQTKRSKPYNSIKQIKSIARATVGAVPASKVIKDHKDRTVTKHKLSLSEQLDPERER